MNNTLPLVVRERGQLEHRWNFLVSFNLLSYPSYQNICKVHLLPIIDSPLKELSVKVLTSFSKIRMFSEFMSFRVRLSNPVKDLGLPWLVNDPFNVCNESSIFNPPPIYKIPSSPPKITRLLQISTHSNLFIITPNTNFRWIPDHYQTPEIRDGTKSLLWRHSRA